MLQDRCDYFILAYESPSFSAAAAKVPMSPQGFTKAIRNMERELGVSLFTMDEDGSRVATPYAHEFYEYAKRVRAERNLLSAAFDRIASSGFGSGCALPARWAFPVFSVSISCRITSKPMRTYPYRCAKCPTLCARPR